jgi:hypothetical protein
MNIDYDTNIDNYSDEELLQLLKISDPIESLNDIQVSNNLDILISQLSISSHGSIIDLFTKAADKIKNQIYLQKNTYEMYSPPISVNFPPVINGISLTSNSNINSDIIDTNRPVILPQYPSAVNINSTPYPQGVINPIEKKTITKVINIDSMFRPNYKNTSSTDFMWDFIQQSETNIVSMRVSSVDIPIMWYAINDTLNRNQFYISLYNMRTEGVPIPNNKILITIPPGNYMTDTFTNTLNLLFKKQGGGLEYLLTDVDAVTSKTIIRAMDKDDIVSDSTGLSTHAAYDPANIYYAPDFYFKLNFFPYRGDYSENSFFQEFQRTVGWYMGFRNFDYKIVKSDTIKQVIFDPFHTSLFYDCAIESESSYSSSRDNYIFLSIDDYNSNCVCQPIVSSIGDSYIGNNILARLTVDTIHNTVLYDNGADKIFKERVYMGPVTVEKLKIRLMNRYGETINLNLNNFSFTLELTKLY